MTHLDPFPHTIFSNDDILGGLPLFPHTGEVRVSCLSGTLSENSAREDRTSSAIRAHAQRWAEQAVNGQVASHEGERVRRWLKMYRGATLLVATCALSAFVHLLAQSYAGVTPAPASALALISLISFLNIVAMFCARRFERAVACHLQAQRTTWKAEVGSVTPGKAPLTWTASVMVRPSAGQTQTHALTPRPPFGVLASPAPEDASQVKSRVTQESDAATAAELRAIEDDARAQLPPGASQERVLAAVREARTTLEAAEKRAQQQQETERAAALERRIEAQVRYIDTRAKD